MINRSSILPHPPACRLAAAARSPAARAPAACSQLLPLRALAACRFLDAWRTLAVCLTGWVGATAIVVATAIVGAPATATAQYYFEDEPINYRRAAESNSVQRLAQRLAAGEVQLTADASGSYLRSVLDLLDVPLSSQTLVFSKTSLQQGQISPQTPRAVYFSDDCYVAWVQNGLIEIAVMDDELGAVFYSVRDRVPAARLHRDRGGCVACHSTNRTQKVPGFLVRSVYTGAEGLPRDFGTTSDHRSPFAERWGGWYVTGTHGNMRHLGNELALDPDDETVVDVDRGANLTSLADRVDLTPYLTEHSDLIALMVMEHQSQMQNFITRAHYETKLALADQDADEATTTARIEAAGEQLVQYLLFCDEDQLTDPIAGTSGFADDFSRRGPHDSRGRSLRQLDLQTRLMRYRCSYLIYSPAFDALPTPVARFVRQRVLAVLSGEDQSPPFAHLSAADRQAILEILRETKADWVSGEAFVP